MTYQSHYFQEAREAQSRAYVPYSNFKVGAYLKTKTAVRSMALMLKMQLTLLPFVLNVLV